jgi:hypothetical protein
MYSFVHFDPSTSKPRKHPIPGTYGSHVMELNRRASFDHTPAYLGPELTFSLARQYRPQDLEGT